MVSLYIHVGAYRPVFVKLQDIGLSVKEGGKKQTNKTAQAGPSHVLAVPQMKLCEPLVLKSDAEIDWKASNTLDSDKKTFHSLGLNTVESRLNTTKFSLPVPTFLIRLQNLPTYIG